MCTPSHMVSRLATFVLISLSLAACNGSSNPTPPGGHTPSGGTGGNSTSGTGGDGPDIFVLKFGGTGNIELKATGTVDASFTASAVTPDLGAEPLTISADTTISVETVGPAVAGTPYLVANDTNLYISDGDAAVADEIPVTGLQINNDITLTIGLNADVATVASIRFTNDIVNNGTVTTEDVDAIQRGHIDFFDFIDFFGGSSSRIDTSGTTNGQHGGDISLTTVFGAANVFNKGSLNSAGADNAGDVAGNGGFVSIFSNTAIENSGAITTSGGSGATGGDGASVFLVSGEDYIYNSGAVTTSGGTGTATGGLGGTVDFTPSFFTEIGEVRNSGAITTAGGDGGTGAGGTGGGIFMMALAADLKNSGAINSVGGSAGGATAGGAGGAVTLISFSTAMAQPAGDVLVSGAITTGGGDADTGAAGAAGAVGMILDASGSLWGVDDVVTLPVTPPKLIWYVASIDASGGSGQAGGDAGTVDVEDDGEVWGGAGYINDEGGSVINDVNITANGGSVVAGATAPATGGIGGIVWLYVNNDFWDFGGALTETVTNNGDMSVSGGNSFGRTTSSENGGFVDFYADSDVTNNGAIVANGGSDTINDDVVTSGFGHDASTGVLYVTDSIAGNATNTGAVTANGGDGEGAGGNGADDGSGDGIWLGGINISNSATISARGGNAQAGLFGSVGGDGGIYAFRENFFIVASCTDTGSLNISGGTGDTAGTVGSEDTGDCP